MENKLLFGGLLLGCALQVAQAAGADAVEAVWPPAELRSRPQPGADSWSANWIGVAGSVNRSNLWTCFRREFLLSKKPKTAAARIAVDSKYWLWVNGRMVVREGGLKRGPTPHDTYFDEVELAPYLRPGTNSLAVLVWYFGKEGFSHKSSGSSGLLFELAAGSGRIVSDKSWRGWVHPAFGETGEPLPNFRLPESNIRFDATRDIAGWHLPGYNDADWPLAVELGKAGCPPWNGLIPRPVPFWKDYGLKSYVNAAGFPAISDGQIIKAKLPYNAQVNPWLKVNAKAGQLIKIQTDNYQGGGEYNVRAEYVTRDGVQEFECPGWMNGHEVWYELPSGVQVLGLKFRETGFDTAFTGTFECDDDFLNRLREKAVRTLYLTMRDTYMDCPDRERALWWGDAVNQLGESFYALDRRSDSLTRKCIRDLIGWQRPDGVLFSPVPAGNWDKDLPLQMLASIGHKGFWTYGLYSGDLATLREVYPGVKRYLEIWRMQPDGLVVPRRGSWEWGDWGTNVDLTLLYNEWYYLALQGMRAMAVALRRPEDLAWIDVRLNSIATAFNPAFWNGREYRASDFNGHTDDRANALAVVAGLAKPAQYPALTEVLKTQEHASPYMEKYVLEALCLMNQPALAQDRMRKRYQKMVDHAGLSTLWEGWGIGSEGFGGGTINHAWSGGPLTIMSQFFAGIAPLTPGFETYEVRPRLGHLTKAAAGFDTVKGRIEVSIARSEGRFNLKLVSPPNTTGRVCIPVADYKLKTIRVNGKGVWSEGKATGRIKGLAPADALTGHACFNVAPGVWEFQCR